MAQCLCRSLLQPLTPLLAPGSSPMPPHPTQPPVIPTEYGHSRRPVPSYFPTHAAVQMDAAGPSGSGFEPFRPGGHFRSQAEADDAALSTFRAQAEKTMGQVG